MPTVTTSLHNGVPTHRLDRDGVATGTLTFGVGMSDEPPTKAGITHLLEHVILRQVQPVPYDHGGTVKEDSVEFGVAGSEGDVSDFLNKISLAIFTISAISDLDLEKKVIEAENSGAFHDASSGLLSYRFGLRGIGVASFGAPTVQSLTRTELVAWAQRWLTKENAALSFTGAVPSGLNITLPSGPPIAHASLPSAVPTPRLVKSSKSGIALSILVPLEYEGFLGAALAYELLARLRHPLGLIYSVEPLVTRLDNESCQLDLVLDPTDRNVDATLRAGMEAIRDLAEKGISTEATDSARSTVTTAIGWDLTSGSSYLDSLVIDGLRGRVTPSPKHLLNLAESLTPAKLRKVLDASLSSLIVAVQDDAALSKKTIRALSIPVDRHSIWRDHSGERAEREHKNLRKNQPPWRGKSSKNRIWVTDSHLLNRERGKLSSITLEDIAVVGDRKCGCICLVDQLGTTTEIDTRDWAKGKKLRRHLLQVFHPEIVRPFPTGE